MSVRIRGQIEDPEPWALLDARRMLLDLSIRGVLSPDGVRALKVPKSDAGSSQDETPGKDKTDLSEYSVETIDIINDNTWA